MKDVPPITLAAWRVQLTALLLTLPGGYQLSRLGKGKSQVASHETHQTLQWAGRSTVVACSWPKA